MITASAEAVLCYLARVQHPQTIKVRCLAYRAGVSRNSAARAIEQLTRQSLIKAERPRQTGPTAVYTFHVLPDGRALALFLNNGNERFS